MKKALLIFAFSLLGAWGAAAQNIAIGERIPELKISVWIKNAQPAPAALTYIEFFHSSNPACIASLDRLKELVGQSNGQLRVLVITQENEDKTTQLLMPYVSDRIGVGLDPSGKTYLNFGVAYVPFGVLVDAKNRALWMGNTLQLTPAFINKIAQ